jgi:hypothetical protein
MLKTFFFWSHILSQRNKARERNERDKNRKGRSQIIII